MQCKTRDADSDVDAEQMTHFDAYAELAAHMSLLQQAEAENARLRAELAATRRANTANAKAAAEHWQTAQTLTDENNRLRDNAAELGKALDMALAERNGAFAEVDAYAAENARLTQELDTRIQQLMQISKDYAALLGAHEQTRAELANTETRARLASDLLQGITEDMKRERQQRRELERQLDAMREAHSVIAARMAAMGC